VCLESAADWGSVGAGEDRSLRGASGSVEITYRCGLHGVGVVSLRNCSRAVMSPALTARTEAAEKMAGVFTSTSGFVGELPCRNACVDASIWLWAIEAWSDGARCLQLTQQG
jgi:hypothetical protein